MCVAKPAAINPGTVLAPPHGRPAAPVANAASRLASTAAAAGVPREMDEGEEHDDGGRERQVGQQRGGQGEEERYVYVNSVRVCVCVCDMKLTRTCCVVVLGACGPIRACRKQGGSVLPRGNQERASFGVDTTAGCSLNLPPLWRVKWMHTCTAQVLCVHRGTISVWACVFLRQRLAS